MKPLSTVQHYQDLKGVVVAWGYDANDGRNCWNSRASIALAWPWEFTERSPSEDAWDKLRAFFRGGRGLHVTMHDTPNPLRNWRGEVMTDAERLERQRRMYEMWRTP